MAIIYAVPFVLLSILCCLICLAIPRLRLYAFQALVAPVAFGLSTVVSEVLVGVIFLFLKGRFHVPLNLGPTVGVVTYVIGGVFGAWLAVVLAGQMRTHFSK